MKANNIKYGAISIKVTKYLPASTGFASKRADPSICVRKST